MDLQLHPLTIDLSRLDGLSQRLVASHHESNYAGAVKRLNAIRGQLAQLDWATAPVFVVNGLKREELIAANSAWLHELYFDVLGGDGQPPAGGLAVAIERGFGSFDRWRVEFTALAKAMGGGSGWALLSISAREGAFATAGLLVTGPLAQAGEAEDQAAPQKALPAAKVTLQQGLQAARRPARLGKSRNPCEWRRMRPSARSPGSAPSAPYRSKVTRAAS
jgi:superoxide dismutase